MVDLTRKGRPVVVAHRGASGHMPENTFASFDLAAGMGVDMVELDVHPTKDGRLAVIHDETLDRTTNGTGRVNEMDSRDVAKLNAAAKSGKPMTERVPFLDDVLEKYPGRVDLMIEVKHGSSIYPGIERSVMEHLERFKATDRVELISFDMEALKNLRKISKDIKLGFIFIGNMASFADALSIRDVDALHGMWNFVSRGQVDHAREKGFATHVWTANSEQDIREALNMRPDGVVSNFPDRVLAAIRR